VIYIAARVSSVETNLLSVNEQHIDLGKCLEGAILKRRIVLKNKSHHAEISILECTPNCVCTSVSLAQSTLLPGQSTELNVVINTAEKSGGFRALIRLVWRAIDNSENHVLYVDLTFSAASPLYITPGYIDFGDIKGSVSVSESLVLRRNTEGEAWDSLSIESGDKENLSSMLSKESGDLFKLTISLNNAFLPIERYKGEVRIICLKNNLPLKRLYIIGISENHVSDIHAKPASLFLGVIEKDKHESITFHVCSPQAIDCLRIESSDEDFAVGKLLASDKHTLTFQALFNTSKVIGDQSGSFLILVSDGSNLQRIRVPFIAYVK